MTQKLRDSKYPEANHINWFVLENINGYQVNFLDKKQHKHSLFSPEGKWVQTTSIVNTKRELPGLVRLVIDESYPQSAYDWMECFESMEESYFVIGVTSETAEKEEMVLTVTKDGQIWSASKDNESHRHR